MRTLTAWATEKGRGPAHSRRFAILVALFFATNLVVSAQSIPSGHAPGPITSAPSHGYHKFKDPRIPPLMKSFKPQTLEAPYHPFTPRDSLHWFITTTIDPANLVG